MSTYPTFSGLFTNFLHFCSYFSLFAFSHFPKSSWMLNCQYNWKKLREHHISWLQKLTQNCDSVNCHRVSHTSQPQPSLNHQDPPTHPQSHVQFLQAELISVNVTTPTQACLRNAELLLPSSPFLKIDFVLFTLDLPQKN